MDRTRRGIRGDVCVERGEAKMAVTKIKWFGPEVGEEEQRAVAAVVASNYINDGPVAREFEARMSERLEVKYAIAVTSGTAAISLALMGLGVGPGDEVLVPDLTFIATANAVRLAGAEVKLVDVEPHRFVMDVDKAAAAIGPRTKAIVPVDVNGRGADYDSLVRLCAERNLKLMCDAAEALGSRHHGGYLGTFGDAGCFSFSANKTVSSGQGGMVVTNSEELYFRLKELKDQGRRHGGSGGDDLHPVLGFNFKYTNLQAAVGLVQFEKLDARMEHFRRRDEWYRKFLADCPGVVFPPLSNSDGEVLQWTDVLCSDRGRVQKALSENGIDTRAFWFPLHRQNPYRAPDDDFAAAIDVSARGLWLPSSFSLTEDEAKTVANVIRAASEEAL
jgi:perosamine synthetase